MSNMSGTVTMQNEVTGEVKTSKVSFKVEDGTSWIDIIDAAEELFYAEHDNGEDEGWISVRDMLIED